MERTGALSAGVNDAIHLWSMPLQITASAFERCQAVLCSHEQERASRYRFNRDARRFIVARGTLRLILSCYTHCSPESLRIETSSTGRPFLRSDGQSAPTDFSLSHSADEMVIAVSMHRRVGVDIENITGGTLSESEWKLVLGSAELRAYPEKEYYTLSLHDALPI